MTDFIHMSFPPKGSVVQLGGKHWRIREVNLRESGALVKADGLWMPGATIEFEVEIKLSITEVNLGK